MPKQNAARSMSLTSQDSYSAVIIADMVAEIPTQPEHFDIERGRKNSAKLENGVDVSNSAGKKVETNLAYDDHADLTSPAVLNVDTMDTTVNSNRTNGTDISKGVILNAQFTHLNKKADNLMPEKSIEMNNTPPVQTSDAKTETKAEIPTDFKYMSGPRKAAFVFSFLPSIMFVLCFAVILPCEKKLPCIQEMWSLNFNDTEITTRLKLSSQKLIYSFVHGASGSNGLIGLDAGSGNQLWNSSVSYVPLLKDCGKLFENSSEACLVTGRFGLFELLNASSGNSLLLLNLSTTGSPHQFRYDPVILPDCLGDGISEFGFVVSHTEIKVVFQGYVTSSVDVSGCDTVPEKLTAWTTKDKKTDLIFICRKDGNDQLMRIPQDTWCSYKNDGASGSETMVLETGTTDSLHDATFLPTPGGLIVWDQNEVSFFDVSGEKNWTVSSEPHSNLNRFLLYGKFSDGGSQIALFSNNASSTLQMSLMDYETGAVTWNKTTQNAEISDISVMKGEKKDFVLVLQRKTERDLKAEAVSHLSEVPTTLISLLSENIVVAEADASKATMVEEVIFVELGSNYYQMVDEKRTPYSEGKSYKNSLTVVHRPNNEIAIVTLKQSEVRFPHTVLRSISVSNWDISLTENRQCSWTV